MLLKAYTRIGRVAYILFCMLRVGIIPLYAWIVHILSEPKGTGFLPSRYEDNVRIALFLTLPLFIAVCSWLWTANYALCRSNDAVPESRFYSHAHKLAVALTIPACINLLTMFQLALSEVWAFIYWPCTGAIVIVWVVCLVYWILNLIRRKHGKAVPDVNQ